MRIVVVSDTHTGHELGLNPPTSFSEKRREINPFAKWVWEQWENFSSTFYDPDYLILNGDITTGCGDINKGIELLTTSFDEQIKWATETLDKIIGKKLKKEAQDRILVINGSGYHGGERHAVNTDRLIAEQLGGTFVGNILELQLNGELLQVSHGSYAGKMNPFTGLQQEMNLASANALRRKNKCPTILIRSHQHEYARVERSTMRGIVTGCWQYTTPYMTKKTANKLPDIGGTIIEIDKGITKIYPRLYGVPEEINEAMRGYRMLQNKKLVETKKEGEQQFTDFLSNRKI